MYLAKIRSKIDLCPPRGNDNFSKIARLANNSRFRGLDYARTCYEKAYVSVYDVIVS